MTVGRIPSVEGGIQPTIFDAKANLLTATANDTPAILAVGANDTILTADSTTATGLKWAAPAGGGGMTELASGSITTTVTLSSIDQTYNELVLFVSNAYSGSANSFYITFNNITTGAYYSAARTTSGSATSTVSNGSISASWNTSNFGSDINATDWKASTSGNNYVIRIPNYAGSTYKIADVSVAMNANFGTERGIGQACVGYFQTTAISRIDLVNATSGTYKLFGVK